jgi:hypothetical protein
MPDAGCRMPDAGNKWSMPAAATTAGSSSAMRA